MVSFCFIKAYRNWHVLERVRVIQKTVNNEPKIYVNEVTLTQSYIPRDHFVYFKIESHYVA